MARQKKNRFVRGMILYAVIFLALTAAALAVFWNFMDAYEQSRPKNTMDEYLRELTAEEMIANLGPWTDALDRNIQSGEETAAVIREHVTEKITYARKGSACTDTLQTYVLRCGSQVIGQVEIRAEEPDIYGFTRWNVDSRSYDFSYLMCSSASVTVPETYTVLANGKPLDDTYITRSGIRYDALEEFYDDYTLPAMVEYTADSVIGTLELTVLDESGNALEDWPSQDPARVLDNTTEQEQQMLGEYLEGFLVSYVRFTGSSNQAASLNYAKLRSGYLIPDSELADRLATALDGLAFAQSYGDKLDEVVIHRLTRIDDSRYFCDVTYLVSTYGKAGKVQTSNNMKVMLTWWEGTLRVESMTRY